MVYEQSIEILFTSANFCYTKHIHGLTEEDFGCTLENIKEKRIHLFTPSKYDNKHSYTLCD